MLSPEMISQGNCFSIRIPDGGFSEVRAQFLGGNYSLFKNGNEFKGILGIPLEQKEGQYPLNITALQTNGKSEEIGSAINIHKTKFPFVSFHLKPAKKKLLSAGDLIQAEWKKIEEVLMREGPIGRWESRFALPVNGEISMLFGTIEKVNGEQRGQHRGLDIAVPAGTPVHAANAGKIVFAEKLRVFGGTLVIDHGQGVHSLYFHLSKFLVNLDDEVAKGKTIALSGNSGVSSGAHLHWGMSVHNLRVNPSQWIKEAF